MLLIGASGGFNKHEDQVSVATLYQAQISSSDNIKTHYEYTGPSFSDVGPAKMASKDHCSIY